MTVARRSFSRAFSPAVAASVAAIVVAACAHAPLPRGDASFELRLLGEQVVPHRLAFGGTVVGGLSGIDYDARADVYYLVSDDRSVFSPARFYTARLRFDERGFHDASLLDVVTLRRPDGAPFSPGTRDDVADGEAIRVDPATGWLWWASEGDRRTRAGTRPVDPFVRAMTRDGRHVASVPVDPMFRMRADAHGPRDNRAFEGLALSPDGGALWVAMEGSLIQDGPMPTATAGAWSRFSRHPRAADGTFGAMALQLAYPIGPLPAVPSLFPGRAVNGVSEILALDDERLLVLERALVIGHGWRIRLFEVDTRGASDVGRLASLADGGFTPMSKRLVVDFDAFDVLVDNLEGMCFGPTLANGHRTLVFVSDDNFNPGEKTQLLAFEVLPR